MLCLKNQWMLVNVLSPITQYFKFLLRIEAEKNFLVCSVNSDMQQKKPMGVHSIDLRGFYRT